MRAMFASLTKDDFGGGKRPAVIVRARAWEDARQRVHRTFDELQIAIANRNQTLVDRLLVELDRACRTRSGKEPFHASTRTESS
jgi:hypothetical protein